MEAVKPTVWITNLAGHDYEKAKSYGNLKHITRGYISFVNLDQLKFRCVTQLIESHGDDFILLSGANIVAVLTVLVFFEMHGRVNLLNYDRVADSYHELKITGENLTDILRVIRGSNGKEANRI